MAENKRPLGVIPSPPDYRDYRLYEFTDIEREFPSYYLAPPYQKEEDIPIKEKSRLKRYCHRQNEGGFM